MTTAADNAAFEAGRPSRRRWVICGLLFTAVVINYVDRQMLGVLKPFMSAEMGWSEKDYGDIIFYFQGAYALSYLLFGVFVDRVGAKIGYATAFVIWQIAHFAHAGASSLQQFFLVRVLLGVGEGGNFPGGMKAVTEWFPKKERALATGIFNAGSNIGAVITPIFAPMIMLAYGWRAAFIISGVIGSLWIIAWLIMYRAPEKEPKVNAAELAHIRSDPEDSDKKIGWFKVLPQRETWAYAIGKFLIDPVWWMLLFWLPDFFKKTFELDVPTFAIVLAAVYLISDVGSVAGGWMSSQLMKRGMSLNASRKITMLVFATLALPYFFIMQIHNLWAATAVVGLVAAAHQAFSANLYTLPGDVFPRSAVGSVIGIGGMLGGVGGMIMAKSVGAVLDSAGGYGPIFAVCGCTYFAALLAVHLLSPKLAPAKV